MYWEDYFHQFATKIETGKKTQLIQYQEHIEKSFELWSIIHTQQKKKSV